MGQIALALALLVVSGLVIRTSIALRQVAPGFTRPVEVQTFVVAIPESMIEARDCPDARGDPSDVDDADVLRAGDAGTAASVALLIGMVGIYGAVAYSAAQRTREIGVRMALGAQISDVRTLFLRHGLWLTAIGIAIGIGIALVLTRLISAFLFGVGPMDPITYAAVSILLAGMTLAATSLPAHCASRVDPVVALRGEA